jgi:phosphatidylserine decarboxylase
LILDPKIDGWNFNRYREGSILGTTFLFILAVFLLIVTPGWLTGFLVVITLPLWVIVLYFFRDPDRKVPADPNMFYSSGDGVVSDITNFKDEDYLDIEYIRVGIFLSVFDVHVQRAPIEGKVEFITHQMGKNLPAYDPAASQENDQIVMGLDTRFGMILVKQISGILARKCYNYAKPGDRIGSGQRYGLIKFGSRVELYLPKQSTILCNIGDKVQAGLTEIAELKD